MHRDAGHNIADLYARALYDAAETPENVSCVEEDLAALKQALAADARFLRFLDTPRIPFAEKRETLRRALAGFHPLTVNFLCVLVDRERLELLDAIQGAYRDHCNRRAGIAEIHIASACPLTEGERSDLRQRLERKLGRRVALTEEDRPELLAGMRVSHEDLRWNASLRYYLQQVMLQVAEAKSGLVLWAQE